MKVAIVKYNAGNVSSVASALRRLGVESILTDVPAHLRSADRVIFPGVGESVSAMDYLKARKLDETIRSLAQPVLAICLGMQLLCASSEENDAECLGLLPYRVRRFSASTGKVPHMGWNNISGLKSPLFNGVPEGARVYFVHSYFVEYGAHTTAAGSYGTVFSAAIRFKNFFGVQFHPERSGPAGATILQNFLEGKLI